MDIKGLLNIVAGCAAYAELQKAGATTRLVGVSGSMFSLLVALESQRTGGVMTVVMEDRDAASYLYNDLYNIIEAGQWDCEVLLLPTTSRRAITTEREDPSGLVQRTGVLSALQSGTGPLVICTWAEAVAQTVVGAKVLHSSSFSVTCGERIEISELEEKLVQQGFAPVEFVTTAGEYACRGGILDVFSFSDNRPYRIDFLGDEVDSIRPFSPSTQLSEGSVESVNIVPNLRAGSSDKTNEKSTEENRISFVEFIAQARPECHKSIWFSSAEQSLLAMNQLFDKVQQKGAVSPRSDFEQHTQQWPMVVVQSDSSHRPSTTTIDFGATPQPSFSRNVELFVAEVERNYTNGVLSYLLTSNQEQTHRVESIFENSEVSIENIPITLHAGFVVPALKVAMYTDHQIFERYLRYKIHTEIDKAQGMTVEEFTALRVGDYVVHTDHGVGKFSGLVRQIDQTTGASKEFIKLTYRDNDVLFVGVQNLHRISKYKTASDTPPPLQKLGSSTWNRLKQTTKKRVKDIARELISLYAKRKMSTGFAYSPDSYLQQELEASFMYEDTPDQHATTEAIKADMESVHPMDRLVCGDVGFGKTELAIRAAFKAATDGKQVAVLVPTTVLSLQHFRSFSKRLKNFPVRVENFSRSIGAKQSKEILADLKAGKIDILIGTHKLLGKAVEWADLGLLIVDEEQKFGVAVKEKLRELKHSVDTLTLTATPIPRTLQFSLMGARDMSIISTPPPNRRPVSSEVHTFDTEIIQQAIEYELSRGGQVFFLHNRVRTIGRIKETIESLVPGARVAVGHGQMSPKELESIMMDFIYGEYDVLVATTIIESGIDIPNANTIIINNAHMFGLSDLHQLRGRVGRTNRKAFCYLLVPSGDGISSDSQRRLRAIEEFSDLGSGFNIAMQDLDIRGAGNVLGGEQSGFMADIGYETYQRIVSEAMRELHDELGSSVPLPPEASTIDCVVETDTSAHLPDSYIGSTSEKLKLYRELDRISSTVEMDAFCARLTDRFGEPPAEALELFDVVLLRSDAAALGFDKVIIKNGVATLYFAAGPQSSYYAGELFGRIMQHVAANPSRFRLREGNKLSLMVRGVGSISGLRGDLIV